MPSPLTTTSGRRLPGGRLMARPSVGTARSRAQAWPIFARMNRDRESSERNSSVRSWPSSITMPKRSSRATDSSMKSSESRPSEPSTPLGSVVSRVISAARRGSNFSRSTTSPFNSSSTSFCVIAPTSLSRRASARVGSLRAPVKPRVLVAPAPRQLDRPGRRAVQPLAQVRERTRREALAAAGRRGGLAAPRRLEPQLALAGLQPEARGGLHQRPPRETPVTGVEIRALLEDLHHQQQRPVAAPLVQEPRRLVDRAERRRGPSDQDAVLPGHPELDGHLRGHHRRGGVREVRHAAPPLDELAVRRPVRGRGHVQERGPVSRDRLPRRLPIFKHRVDGRKSQQAFAGSPPEAVPRPVRSRERPDRGRPRARPLPAQEAQGADGGGAHQAPSSTSAPLQPPKPMEVLSMIRGRAARARPG